VPHAQASKTAPNIVGQWSGARAATEESMKMMQMYKDLGDFEGQPYLKFHNPRTFEDMEKPIPNFKCFGLKAGAWIVLPAVYATWYRQNLGTSSK
jgi:hypothetical protein